MDATTAAALALLALLALWALVRPVRLSVAGEGRATGTGWAAACGASLGPLAGTVVAAHGVPPRLAVHAFGRPVLARALGGGRTDLRALWARLTGHVDPEALAGLALDELARVRVSRLDLDLEGGLADPAATAWLAGLTHAAAGALAPLGTLSFAPTWEGPPSLEGKLALELRASPLLVAFDLAAFAARNVRLRPVARAA